MTKDFDVVVIGGGPAGISGATTAGVFGKRVALVEKLHDVGGAGINTGTIPSKTLRETALALSGMRSRKLFGVDLSLRREATVADFMHHKATVAAHERRRREEQMRTYNVETFHGAANFVDPNTIHVAPDTLLRGERILIATGSSPVRPAEFPFEHPHVHDSDEILEIGTLPKTLAVVGAGVIGAEYACTFAALGVVDVALFVVVPTQEHEVVEVGGPAVLPVPEVVRFAAPGSDGAAGFGAVLVAGDEVNPLLADVFNLPVSEVPVMRKIRALRQPKRAHIDRFIDSPGLEQRSGALRRHDHVSEVRKTDVSPIKQMVNMRSQHQSIVLGKTLLV